MTYICTNDAYCPTADEFSSVEEFIDMCRDCFGSAPSLLDVGDLVVDSTGAIVLRRVSE